MKKILALILALTMIATCGICLIGCDGDGIDPNKKQIYVGYYESGVGQAWLDELARAYAETDMGKQYQIVIDPKSGDTLSTNRLKDSITEIRQDLIFTNALSYPDVVPFGDSQVLVADLKDTIMESNPYNEGNKSIWDTMTENGKKSTGMYYNGNGELEHVYGLDYFNSYYGMVYDRDLFEEREILNLDVTSSDSSEYSKIHASRQNKKYVGLDATPNTPDDNWGADGLQNTFDDGLPATWEDFKLLLDVLVDMGIEPFTYCQSVTGYQNDFLNMIYASYEGDDYSLLGSLSGTDSDLGVITKDTAWKLAQQEGKLVALKVAEHLVKGRKNDDNSISGYVHGGASASYTATNAQIDFLHSRPNEEMQDIAFLIEGSWWENEAREIFNDCADEYGDEYGFGERNFAYCPIPKFVGSLSTDGIKDQKDVTGMVLPIKAQRTTGGCLMNATSSNGRNDGTNRDYDVSEGVKDFIKFVYSQANNALFTQITGLSRSDFRYELNQDQIKLMTPYQRSMWEFATSQNIRYASAAESAKSETWYYNGPYLMKMVGFQTNFREFASQNGYGEKANVEGSPLREFTVYKNNSFYNAQNWFDAIAYEFNQNTWNENITQG